MHLRVLAKMPLSLGTLRSLWPTITHLSFELLPPDPLNLIKLTQQTLVSLSITVSFHNLNRRKFDPIHLPNLRSLSLLSLDWRSQLQDPVKPLLDALKVKSLQNLALGLDAPPPPLISTLASFLDLNGRNLRSLCIRIGALDRWESIPIENLLIKCPTLERLAIWPGRPYILSHPELRWLDIGPWFYRDRDNRSTSKWIEANTSFPSLEGFRNLDTPGALFLPIVTTLEPDMTVSDGDEDEVEVTYPGIKLWRRRGFIKVEASVEER
ncbi:hypothetical protein H0H93_001229 [Arthromyces matolae]|nr:hypothetical protein H0H93_001229 [Arthromyces matolae]